MELWTEKYRPRKLKDLLISDTIKKKLTNMLDKNEIPNMIITGDPGIGKTSTILYLAKKLFGKYYNNFVLETNASDKRGTKNTENIVDFCKLQIPEDCRSKQKLILLDEADNMTHNALTQINYLMEKYQKTVRFAFTCNDFSKIIEPIQSRCLIFKYNYISKENTLKRLKYICKNENITFHKKGLLALYTISDGDIRNSINNLQLVSNKYDEVNEENVYDMCDIPHPQKIKNILDLCIQKNYSKTIELIMDFIQSGYMNQDILVGMKNFLKNDNSFEEKIKIKYLIIIGKNIMTMTKGIDTKLQLISCMCELINS